nr:DUF4166 domain-containing protein [Stenotrophomonas mori]
MFEHVLGPAFARLPPLLRAVHTVASCQTWQGRGRVRRGRHWLVAPCAWLARLPPSADDLPVAVTFRAGADGERWDRRFGTARMASRLWQREGRLLERLGAVRLGFVLTVEDGEIHWRAERVWVLGIVPLPAAWSAAVQCREREHAGRYEFRVEVALPLIGPLIRYEGWLLPVDPAG